MAFGKNQGILCHIVRYCNDITEDLSTIENYNEFFYNRMCKNSVGMSIAQIGVLAAHLSDEYINAIIFLNSMASNSGNEKCCCSQLLKSRY